MKTLKYIFIGAIILVVLIVGIAFLLPNKSHIERKATIHNTPDVVYGIVNDLHNWHKWDPWSAIDPNEKTTFTGNDKGVGSNMSWTSDKLGNGNMTIETSVPNEKIVFDLGFGGKGTAKADMEFKPVPDGTEVTWGIDMDLGYNPIMRYMGLAMDKMVGSDYEKGLAKLDGLAKDIKPATIENKPIDVMHDGVVEPTDSNVVK